MFEKKNCLIEENHVPIRKKGVSMRPNIQFESYLNLTAVINIPFESLTIDGTFNFYLLRLL